MPDNNIANIQTRDYKKRSPREAAYHAIDSERDYQDKKYPDKLTFEQHRVLVQEYADRIRTTADTPTLMRKIAALAVRFLEEHAAPVRE